MADKPLVSVVVIFLDEERFLADAVESVLAQTYPHWELILVDDGSSDGSPEIARGFAAQDPRIRYVTHPGGDNRGMSASRNRGVGVSRGELVAFLDGDDAWLPEKLDEQVELLDRHPEVAMVYGRTQWWFSWTGQPEDSNRDHLYEPGVLLDSVVEPPRLVPSLIRTGGSPPYTCSVIVRRSAYERLGGFEESFRGLYEDQVFFAKVFIGEKVYVSSRCWDRYRQHDRSACAVGVRTGDLHPLDLSPTRGVFLEWLDGYLESRAVRDPALRDALTRELEPYRYPAAPAIVESVDVPGRFAPELVGCAIDLPEAEARTAGRWVHVMGWALGESSLGREIELRTGDRVLGRASIEQRRPDLSLAFRDARGAEHAGFRASVSLTGTAPLGFDAVAVLDDGTRVEMARFRAARCFRERDAEIGFELVSVVIAGSDAAATRAAIESVLGQSYPRFEIVVVTDEATVADAVERFPGLRLLRGRLEDWQAASLRVARGALIVFLGPGECLPRDAFADGIASLAASGSVQTEANGMTLHRRFALSASPAAEEPSAPEPTAAAGPGANASGPRTRSFSCTTASPSWSRIPGDSGSARLGSPSTWRH